MDQVLGYVKPALYYGLNAALVVCFLILLGHLIWNRQWLFALLSLAFTPMCGGGFLFALVIGWQEATAWKIRKLMYVYTALIVVCGIMMAQTAFVTMTTPSPPVDPKAQAKQKAAKH